MREVPALLCYQFESEFALFTNSFENASSCWGGLEVRCCTKYSSCGSGMQLTTKRPWKNCWNSSAVDIHHAQNRIRRGKDAYDSHLIS